MASNIGPGLTALLGAANEGRVPVARERRECVDLMKVTGRACKKMQIAGMRGLALAKQQVHGPPKRNCKELIWFGSYPYLISTASARAR
jgi:hypothetical protein